MDNKKLNNWAFLFAGIGLLISIYLTITHYYPSVPLVCSTHGFIDCNNVLNSQYAIILGVPMAVMGIVFFLAEFFVILFIKDNDFFIALGGVGLAVVAYALFSEYAVGSICEYCTGVHVCTIALFYIAYLKGKNKT